MPAEARGALAPVDESWWSDHRDVAALGLTVLVLATWNIGRSSVVPDHYGIPASLAMAGVLGGLGFLGGLSWIGLGPARNRMLRGLAFGGAVLGIVAVVLLRRRCDPRHVRSLNDSRVHMGAATMLFEVLVAIPFGTVVLEELAFRGTLLGLLRRRLSAPWAIGAMSVPFGLWHVKGVLHNATGGIAIGTVVGTVIATTVAGVGHRRLHRLPERTRRRGSLPDRLLRRGRARRMGGGPGRGPRTPDRRLRRRPLRGRQRRHPVGGPPSRRRRPQPGAPDSARTGPADGQVLPRRTRARVRGDGGGAAEDPVPAAVPQRSQRR